MNIHIKSASPKLQKVNQFKYQVLNWHIKGRILVDEGECKCKEKDFDLLIDVDNLNPSESEVIKKVIDKLCK